MTDTHHELLEDLKHCPDLTGNARQRASQADTDALRLVADIRDLDPRAIWGRISRWSGTNPDRVLAALVALATRVDIAEVDSTEPPAWTLPFGGPAALHPDYKATELTSGQVTNAAKHHDEILRLADGGLTQREIALRLGIRESTVGYVRREAGDRHRPPGPSSSRRDAEIAELFQLGYSTDQVAESVGCSVRTVERARVRIAAAAERGAAVISIRKEAAAS